MFLLYNVAIPHLPKKEIIHQFAEANVVANFKKVQMLGFTFNAQRDTAPSSSRQQD
ncbi:MAG: hypothetical protein WKF91_10335 [Segetibacter sp.]